MLKRVATRRTGRRRGAHCRRTDACTRRIAAAVLRKNAFYRPQSLFSVSILYTDLLILLACFASYAVRRHRDDPRV